MNARQMEIFHSVMTSGTVSRGAELLRISQPSASKAIMELERELGFALFERVKGRLMPTAEGQLLHREVEKSFVGMSRLKAAAARIRDFGAGQVRFACLSAHSTTVAPMACAAFRARHPDIAVTMQTHMSSVVRDLVFSGEFDFGLAADEIDLTGVDARPFLRTRAKIGLPLGHPLCAREVIRIEDLDGADFIALAPEDTTRKEAEKLFAASNVAPRVVFETPFSSTVCAMIRAGVGVGIVNPMTAEIYNGRYIELRRMEPAVHFRTLMLTSPRSRPSQIVQSCMDAFVTVADTLGDAWK